MGVANPTADPANVVQALVYTLLDVFDATRDLYKTLKNKERRDYETSLRAKGYPDSRRISYIEDDSIAGDESIVMDKAAVTKEFEIAYQDVGAQFAVGDVITQTALQSQLITLQSVLVTTFLYGPTSDDPISHQLSNVLAASRAAGTSSVDILAAQHQRQRALSRSTHSPTAQMVAPKALPYPVTTVPSSGTSTALAKSHRESSRPRSGTLVRTNPTIADVASRPRPSRTDTESTSFSDMTSYDTQSSTPRPLYCLYATDLQRDPSQALASSITSSVEPYCPYCKRILNLSPGKSWEIFKDDEGHERCFRIQNRFVVKCHRDSVDGGYSCVLCTRSATIDTVCGDVKALIRHVWMDHGAGEFELEEDIPEFVENPAPEQRKRRDSVVSSQTESRRKSDSRRSISLGPGRRNGKRYVETTEVWAPRPPVGRERG
ncbi:hypothetical protein BDV96DRAFT_651256 [Lophiotrema nucula]|uniref:Uncharacterized protein n=1 Tax=Lophiotrema nucula TaxID=690887 RepID=A0A6A5YSY1_9PLEO|nr:hypothetical protein BDV96DRAFT_651256 [Lophiotrema nucula]